MLMPMVRAHPPRLLVAMLVVDYVPLSGIEADLVWPSPKPMFYPNVTGNFGAELGVRRPRLHIPPSSAKEERHQVSSKIELKAYTLLWSSPKRFLCVCDVSDV